LTVIGSYDALEPRAQAVDIFGFPVKVMHLRDLICVKEAIGRLKDRAVLEILRETLRLSEKE
jgi:predicted nucleotidyltransferase